MSIELIFNRLSSYFIRATVVPVCSIQHIGRYNIINAQSDNLDLRK